MAKRITKTVTKKDKVPAKYKGEWTNINDAPLTWDDLIEEVKLARATLANYEALLFKYKVTVRECANASYQAKKQVYGWTKPEKTVKAEPVVVEKKTKKKRKK